MNYLSGIIKKDCSNPLAEESGNEDLHEDADDDIYEVDAFSAQDEKCSL